MQSIVGYSDDDHSNDEHTSPRTKPRSKDSLLRRPVSTPTLKTTQAPANEPRDRQDTDPLPESKARGKSKSRIDPGVIRRASSKPAPEEPAKEPSPRFQDLSLGPNSPAPSRTEDVALRPPPIPGLDNFGIPPPSDHPVDAELSAKLAKFLALKKQGTHFNDILMRNKSFNNPHIYTSLVEFVEVDETGTNFPKEMWDPTDVQPEWYADELAAAQKKKSAESAAAQAPGKRSRIAFNTGSTSGVHPSTLEKSRDDRSRHDERNRSEGSKRRHDDGGRFHPYQPKADMGWMPRSHSSSGRSRW